MKLLPYGAVEIWLFFFPLLLCLNGNVYRRSKDCFNTKFIVNRFKSGFSFCRAFFLAGCRSDGISFYRDFVLLGFRSDGFSFYWAVAVWQTALLIEKSSPRPLAENVTVSYRIMEGNYSNAMWCGKLWTPDNPGPLTQPPIPSAGRKMGYGPVERKPVRTKAQQNEKPNLNRFTINFALNSLCCVW